MDNLRNGHLADGSRCGEERRNRFAGAQPDRSVQAIADLGGRIDSETLVDGRGKIGRGVGADRVKPRGVAGLVVA